MLTSPPTAQPHHRMHQSPTFLHKMLGFGLPGLVFVAAVDASPIPLPIPGSTDILLILLAARSGQWLLLTVLATVGSCIGGYASYHTGRIGGMAALKRYVPARYLERITQWTGEHSIIAVALPALLPPPMPLTPFTLAAGALLMPLRTYLTTFTLSRAVRHGFAAWLGVYYGRHILRLWNHFYARWHTTMLTGILIAITLSIAVPVFAMWRETHQRKQRAAA